MNISNDVRHNDVGINIDPDQSGLRVPVASRRVPVSPNGYPLANLGVVVNQVPVVAALLDEAPLDLAEDNCCDPGIIFLGRDSAVLSNTLQNGTCKWLRTTALALPSVLNLTSRAIAFASGPLTFPIGTVNLFGYGVANTVSFCLTGNTLGERYELSKFHIFRASFGIPGAVIASPIGFIGMAISNLILKEKVLSAQKEFLDHNITTAAAVSGVACALFFAMCGCPL